MSRAERKLAKIKAEEELKKIKQEKKLKQQQQLANAPKSVKVISAVIVGAVFLFILIGALSVSDNSSDNKSDTPTANTSQSGEKVSLSDDDAEKFCQDDNLTPILAGNPEYSDVNMIDVWNYNKNYTDTGDYDENGYPIMTLTWNGKRGDNTLSFNCDVSGTKDSPELHYLSMGSETMRGNPDYKVYDKQ